MAAIGITNQRETLVIWDKFTGLPVYNAIVWMDCRGDEVIHNFTNAHDKEWYRQKTGLPLSSYFTGPKLNWALTHVPEVKKGFEEHRILVGTIDCWLIWNLTGGIHVPHALSLSVIVGRSAHHGHHQRESNDDDEHPNARLGRRSAGHRRRGSLRSPAHRVLQRGLRHGRRLPGGRENRGYFWSGMGT